MWVNVISTFTGLPPNVAGSNAKDCAAAITAASNTGCGAETSVTVATAPVSSTSSFTVTATGAVIGGASAGNATSVGPWAFGPTKLCCAASTSPLASVGTPATPASGGACASASAGAQTSSSSASLSAT